MIAGLKCTSGIHSIMRMASLRAFGSKEGNFVLEALSFLPKSMGIQYRMAANHAEQIANMRQSFFNQQLLNDQFIRSEATDVGLPGFLEDFYNTYFREAERFIGILRQELLGDPLDIESIQVYLDEFRSNSTSSGAVKVLTQINRCIDYIPAMDFAGCWASLEEANNEMKYLKRKLKDYFRLKKQGPPTVIDDCPDFGDDSSSDE